MNSLCLPSELWPKVDHGNSYRNACGRACSGVPSTSPLLQRLSAGPELLKYTWLAQECGEEWGLHQILLLFTRFLSAGAHHFCIIGSLPGVVPVCARCLRMMKSYNSSLTDIQTFTFKLASICALSNEIAHSTAWKSTLSKLGKVHFIWERNTCYKCLKATSFQTQYMRAIFL